MTFFSQEKKKLNEAQKANQNIGPGLYSPQNNLHKNQSYAPFGSLQRKPNILKENKKEQLGPGSYNINRDIIKPSIIQYENDNCVIIKINEQGNSQFKSKIQRFANNPNQETPGPGAYQLPQNKQRRNQRRAKSFEQSFNQMKQLYNRQYQQKRKPTLMSDKPEVPEEEQKSSHKAKGVLRWDLNKKERFSLDEKEHFREQDKSILLEKASLQKRKSKFGPKESSFFASKSMKSCFDQIIYKSANPFKVEIRKMLGFQDQSPGPGSYDPLKLKSQQKPSKFQFFGSTISRFDTKQRQLITVGPGDYQLSKTPSKLIQSRKNHRKPPSNPRKTVTEPDQEQPNIIGPGYYNIQSEGILKPTFNMKHCRGLADFGSVRPRFEDEIKQKEELKPEYISFMAQEDEQRKKRIEEQFNVRRQILKTKKSSVFASESKRITFPENQQRKDNPFGFYQVGIDDISMKIKKKQQIMQQFAQCNLVKPGFSSGVERFKAEKQPQQTHKDCWCQIKEVQKKNIEHMSPAFQSNCLRTQVFQTKNNGPAVGQYAKDSSFIKQSFNSRFIKQNTNKTKKIKIWKNKH